MNKKIKFLREALNLTTKEISAFLNMSTYKYASFEKDAADIPCDMLLLLSRIYKIDIYVLIDDNINNDDLMPYLTEQGLLGSNKADIIEKLKRNLFLNNDNTKMNYHSIKVIRYSIQQNIIDFISSMLTNSNMNHSEFAHSIKMDKNKLNSILTKKRFIKLEELLRLSEISGTPIHDIINA